MGIQANLFEASKALDLVSKASYLLRDVLPWGDEEASLNVHLLLVTSLIVAAWEEGETGENVALPLA